MESKLFELVNRHNQIWYDMTQTIYGPQQFKFRQHYFFFEFLNRFCVSKDLFCVYGETKRLSIATNSSCLLWSETVTLLIDATIICKSIGF